MGYGNNWGGRDGTAVRALESRAQRHMWVEFVVGSCPCSDRFFSGYFRFPLSSKTNISKFQFDLDTVDEEPLCVKAGRFDTKSFQYKSFRYTPKSFCYKHEVDIDTTQVVSIQPVQ